MTEDQSELVVPLSQLDSDRAERHTDARGWKVLAAGGIPTGRVNDLLIDTRTASVHAFIIELSGNTELGSGAYRVMVPAANAEVDPALHQVRLDSLTWSEVALLPHYGEEPPRRQEDDTVVIQPDRVVPEAVSNEVRMTLFEEELDIQTRSVPVGEVVVGKRVETERLREVVSLTHEDVVIERRPIPEGVGFEPRTEGDVTYIPLVREELVVEKRLVAREELVVRKRRVTEEQVVEETVRREVADIREPDGARRPE